MVQQIESEDFYCCRSNWADWRWQIANRICSLQDTGSTLSGHLEKTQTIKKFPMAITPYYASLIKSFDENDPIFLMSFPSEKELTQDSFSVPDPLEESIHMAVPHLIHRYPDRALIITTTTCAMYCRHCTRKRIAGHCERTIDEFHLNTIVQYLNEHSEIHDVIISGGDPLTLETEHLEDIISRIRSVKHIDIIRIGTRAPVTIPMRIDDELVNMLKKYHPIWVNTHFNHCQEVTIESREACEKLADAGIPVGNQTVLLKGVNDSPEIIENLCRQLVKIRVRPYYLFQCDLTKGCSHFRTPISTGISIVKHLRGRISGLAIPTFIVDLPNGGGKIPLLPEYIIDSGEYGITFKSPEGKIIRYVEDIC